MKLGTKMIVASGQGTFVVYFLQWLDDVHIRCVNRFGGELVINQADIEDVFI